MGLDLAREGVAASDGAADLLDRTLSGARRQVATVTPDGRRLDPQLDGVIRTQVRTHVDERGWLVELFDPRWSWLEEPFAFAYATTVRPGYAKGWGLHKEHSDRYFLLLGELEVILYDVRPDSPTRGQIARHRLSQFDRGHLLIPPLVWHASRNIGGSEAVLLNFPTMGFDHANPDKYTLPLDNDVIPFSFDGAPGW